MKWVGIFQVRIFRGGDFPGGSLMGGDFPGGNFPKTSFIDSILMPHCNKYLVCKINSIFDEISKIYT